MNKQIIKKATIAGREMSLSTGQLAPQAGAAVMGTYGETVVLAAVTANPNAEDRGYFPLSVDYQERLYAGGRIKGSRWIKREGRPTDNEVLNGRVIDRSIRPLFPKGYMADVQVIVQVLSVDMENDPSILAANAVSAALAISSIPWDGPVASVNVGLDEKGKHVPNPLREEDKKKELDLVVSTTKGAIVMIEAGANQVSESQVLDGIDLGQKEGAKVLKLINDLVSVAGEDKETFEKEKVDKKLQALVEKTVNPKLDEIIPGLYKKNGFKHFRDLVDIILESIDEEQHKQAKEIADSLLKEAIRTKILSGKRPDGRSHDEVRELSSQVGILPRTHGSGLFERGLTQALSVATLGSPSLSQLLESAEGESEKLYMHQYDMPPYSVGETGRFGFASRRETGHGALAERAIIPVLPSSKEFPYAIRVVTEVLSSNGSTSMASTCGSTLSLMDAGVPITAPVSGIAMGLIISGKTVAMLTDIAGVEDFNGDMDFKVAGTEKGITAMQMDVKTLNLTLPILKKALAQAKIGRAHILKSMLKTIDAPRKELSVHAPKIKTIQIDVSKIGEVIGPSGRIIKKIIADTGAEVEVKDDGTVNVTAASTEAMDAAVSEIEMRTKDPVPGEVYEGEVKRIQPFGAFVEFLPGRDGLVHISDMSTGYVSNPDEVVKMGEKVSVRVKEIDSMGRINLSMVLDPGSEPEKRDDRRPQRNDRGRQVHGRQDRGRRPQQHQRRGGDRRQGGRSQEGRSSGPHFPTSRLISRDNSSNDRRGRR